MCQARKAWLDQSWEDCQNEQELAQGRENTLLAQSPQEWQEHNKEKRVANNPGLLEWKMTVTDPARQSCQAHFPWTEMMEPSEPDALYRLHVTFRGPESKK